MNVFYPIIKKIERSDSTLRHSAVRFSGLTTLTNDEGPVPSTQGRIKDRRWEGEKVGRCVKNRRFEGEKVGKCVKDRRWEGGKVCKRWTARRRGHVNQHNQHNQPNQPSEAGNDPNDPNHLNALNE
jgi:hypothetical protein